MLAAVIRFISRSCAGWSVDLKLLNQSDWLFLSREGIGGLESSTLLVKAFVSCLVVRIYQRIVETEFRDNSPRRFCKNLQMV